MTRPPRKGGIPQAPLPTHLVIPQAPLPTNLVIPQAPLPRPLGPSRGSLVARGLTSVLVLVASAVGAVAYGGGTLNQDPLVYTDIPASAGLLIGAVGVQFNGVQIGEVVDIDSGVEQSRVTMRIDPTGVPASAEVRVVPRTLFGDVYLKLVHDSTDQKGYSADTTPTVEPGDVLTVDTSAEAVQLSQVYRQVTDLLDRLEPARAQAALTAVSTALQGRGESLGATIDRLASLSATLEPQAHAVLDHTAQARDVADALAAATPDVLATIEATTTLSHSMLDRSAGVEALLTNAASLGVTAGTVAEETTPSAITVIHSGAAVSTTVAMNSSGLSSTLEQFAPFGAAGARIFASGRFDITAVPDFSSPLPYTAADCPRYPELDGPNCGLAEVQDSATGTSQPLNPASTMLLAPLLRGTEVSIR
ncbi:MCE family protein [Rhodococcus sp. G-MC3]|uniref:MCE family protein n=1 Tax=Rhodococcus sp. G-MC3 TaxID=3046209 RepID=UPI0024BA89E5|nr:MCE family protein [Rhodococcus sp. G-MC3]MDJ0395378.1 MCE family protein [Rhodococcus sp. G-MC3]